ncbi:MAG: hypothetical protein UX80_C0006G0071 [Candidatus Amesbacteria bacterium GW2011_GWA2_47_11b]|uniref:Uncharacterized protein n=1 Tax=Candidatus Amesbacteria bacterium GW2011_GWA2_47_11b TaxID=1618358 RepID=A0A0G1RLW7_9BACT|nr:MAG: hypothetical protein UX80_C0006G0071 [Candidatus Amesbacteria bacterium GW2011_GWA2_47_11b]
MPDDVGKELGQTVTKAPEFKRSAVTVMPKPEFGVVTTTAIMGHERQGLSHAREVVAKVRKEKDEFKLPEGMSQKVGPDGQTVLEYSADMGANFLPGLGRIARGIAQRLQGVLRSDRYDLGTVTASDRVHALSDGVITTKVKVSLGAAGFLSDIFSPLGMGYYEVRKNLILLKERLFFNKERFMVELRRDLNELGRFDPVGKRDLGLRFLDAVFGLTYFDQTPEGGWGHGRWGLGRGRPKYEKFVRDAAVNTKDWMKFGEGTSRLKKRDGLLKNLRAAYGFLRYGYLENDRLKALKREDGGALRQEDREGFFRFINLLGVNEAAWVVIGLCNRQLRWEIRRDGAVEIFAKKDFPSVKGFKYLDALDDREVPIRQGASGPASLVIRGLYGGQTFSNIEGFLRGSGIEPTEVFYVDKFVDRTTNSFSLSDIYYAVPDAGAITT